MHEPTANHPGVILRGALKASANDCPSGCDGDGIDATESITNVAAEQGTKQSTGQVVHRDLGGERESQHAWTMGA